MRTLRGRAPLSVALVAALTIAVGCGGDDAGTGSPVESPPTTAEAAGEASLDLIATHDAWVRMPAAGQTVAAAYVTFVNGAESDVRLLSVASELATAELHETIADDDGVMRMQERTEGFVVPAGGELVMAPGGAHIMLIGIDPLDLAMVDEIEFSFEFEGLGTMSVTAEVRRDTTGGGMHGGAGNDMHGDDMHGDDMHGDDMHEGMHGDDDHDGMHGDGEAMHGEGMPAAELDVEALHALDDELHAGVLEPDRQRMVVGAALASLEQTELPSEFDADAFVDLLMRLDAAIEAGDIDAAKALAFEAHDIAHALVPHSH